MGIRSSIREWMDDWEKALGKYLGWDEPDPPVKDLGHIWNRWEKAWCDALDWDYCELQRLWKNKNLKDNTWEVVNELSNTWPQIYYYGTDESDKKRHIALYLFYQTFRRAYVMASQKIEKNKDMNKKCKRRFIYLLSGAIIIHIPLFLVYAFLFVRGFSTSHMVMVETFVAVALVLAALIFAKDLDIQKYQETLARHKRFQNHREQEMLRFLLEAEPYNHRDANKRVDAFVKTILAIEEKNIEKYYTNMEDKEKGMLEELLGSVKNE